MEAYDLSHKLALAGRHASVPFSTGPEYTNSVPGVPVLAMVRIFIAPEAWSEENVLRVGREISLLLGPTEQFDVGMTLASKTVYDPKTSAFGVTARLTKLDPNDPHVFLRITEGNGDRVYAAVFPGLKFEPSGQDFWRSIEAPGSVKQSAEA
ncbi:MAG: hypothetical protein ACRDFS_01865 [Chloroflexota bacterium]